MPDRSFRVSVVPRKGGFLLTGPMTLGAAILAACAVTGLSGLDRTGLAFCYFKAMTGHACFTCGSTRALGHLARLEGSSAFAVQPLVTAALLFFLTWAAVDTILSLAGKRTMVRVEGRALRLLTVGGVALATLNWLYLLAAGV